MTDKHAYACTRTHTNVYTHARARGTLLEQTEFMSCGMYLCVFVPLNRVGGACSDAPQCLYLYLLSKPKDIIIYVWCSVSICQGLEMVY